VWRDVEIGGGEGSGKWTVLEVYMSFRDFVGAESGLLIVRHGDGNHVCMTVIHLEIVTRTG
jgi:hypothetical protein